MLKKDTELLFEGIKQTSDTLGEMQMQIQAMQQGLSAILEQLEKMYPEEAEEYKQMNNSKE